MKVEVKRTDYTEESTIGELFVDGVFECFTLEDRVRSGPKVHGKTAIPYGTYEVMLTYSNRFKRVLPLLFGVPGFEGIRIHPGNTAENTEGCLLVGKEKAKNQILHSRDAFNPLMLKLTEAQHHGKIYITIADGRAPSERALA